MARLWTSGAEIYASSSGATSAPDGKLTSTGVTRDTAVFRSGVAAWKNTEGGGYGANPLQLGGASAASNIELNPFTGNVMRLIVGGSTVYTSAALSSSTWYMFEVSVVVNGSSQFSSYDFRIDGSSVFSGSIGTPFAPGSSVVNLLNFTSNVQFAQTFSASTTYYARLYWYTDWSTSAQVDDFALNDSTGGSQTSWPGSGKVVLLKPISDSAVGSGWTDDNAATTNIYTAVDNTPPNGIADTSSGGGNHQIRNASSATADYDANMTTYTTAGIASGDTINVVIPVISTGTPSATGAKTGNLVLVSNPAGATDSLGGFRGAGNAGTWPTNWKWTKGTPQYAPSVTLGTSPVVRADITGGTATRIAMVCAMGMYVDYTPATAATFATSEIIWLQGAVGRQSTW